MAEPSKPTKELRETARYASLGLQFGITILIFSGLGYVLDDWLGSSPYGLLTGVLLGSLGACVSLFYATGALKQKKDESDKTGGVS